MSPRKLLLILVLGMMARIGAAQESPVKILYKDYSLLEPVVRPIAFGYCTWSDGDVDWKPAAYGQVAIISYAEALRLNAGMVCGWHGKFRPRIESSITMMFDIYGATVEVGVYYAPFWGLTHTDDPWGLMLGYTF